MYLVWIYVLYNIYIYTGEIIRAWPQLLVRIHLIGHSTVACAWYIHCMFIWITKFLLSLHAFCQLILSYEWNSTIDNAIGITWCLCQYQQHQMTEKNLLVSHFSHLELKIQWCYWLNYQYHVMPTLASHDHKSHVVSCFNYHDLTNKVASLTMPSIRCCTLFQLSSPNEQNGVTDDVITWQQCWYQWGSLTKYVMFHLILTTVT